jgi:hypothetical protein
MQLARRYRTDLSKLVRNKLQRAISGVKHSPRLHPFFAGHTRFATSSKSTMVGGCTSVESSLPIAVMRLVTNPGTYRLWCNPGTYRLSCNPDIYKVKKSNSNICFLTGQHVPPLRRGRHAPAPLDPRARAARVRPLRRRADSRKTLHQRGKLHLPQRRGCTSRVQLKHSLKALETMKCETCFIISF